MKKVILCLVMAVTSIITANAQQKTCGSSEKQARMFQQFPQGIQNQLDLEEWTKKYAKTEQRGVNVVYIVPVVFHIIHNYGPENISDAQVYDAVDVINRDYRLQNADTAAIVPSFQALKADIEIEFRLATLDPNGNCTNGINHVQSMTTYGGDDAAKFSGWPNNMYLNIWTVNHFSPDFSTAAAYAYLPGTASNSVDGVISLYNYVGSIGESSVNNSRTITHEIGHCLNLRHTWGPGNDVGLTCGDDGVSDTPITKGHSACVLNDASCNPPTIENVQNYMDYSYCTNMFTLGQKTRMRAALTATASNRSSLWQASNLAATGVSGPPVTCVPIADFALQTPGRNLVCEGGTVHFKDFSHHATITSWMWYFPGGVPSTSTDTNPDVMYPTAGIYDVSLVVANSVGQDSIVRPQYVRVSAVGATTGTIPYVESFEDTTVFPINDGFLIDNDGLTTWTRVTNAASGGSASIKINNYTNVAGQIDSWIGPPLDLSNIAQPTMTFKVANAQRNSLSNDQLQLSFSYNCGESWIPRWTRSGASLSTAGILSVNFTPNASQWVLHTTGAMSNLTQKPNVRFKFENKSDRGNNTYIDEINITGTIVNIDEADDVQTGFTLWPNPSDGETRLQFFLSSTQKVKISITDVLGRNINNLLEQTLQEGDHNFMIPAMTPGIYFIDLIVNNKHHARRLIIS
jgi:PKD repeat protein